MNKEIEIPDPFKSNLPAKQLILKKIHNAGKAKSKYNKGLVQKTEEDTGVQAADYRDGSDTGSEMESVGIDYEQD